MKELMGPDWTEQWTSWKYRTSQQYINVNIKNELDKFTKQDASVCIRK